jgi:L-lysine 6-transaminase
VSSPALQFPLSDHGEENAAARRHALDGIDRAFAEHRHDIACFIAEPIQAEGGDRHLSPDFLQAVQQRCRANDALFVLDEVQTGVGLTGTAWAYQQLGLEPDIVAWGKKTHVCGLMAGGRVEEVHDNVFAVSSRLNSTFGGGLVDMVRATHMLRIVREDGLIDRAAKLGEQLLDRIRELEERHEFVFNSRGRGLMCAFDTIDRETRDEIIGRLYRDEQVMILGCGDHSIRFRPTLTVTEDEIAEAVDAIERVLRAID